MKITKGHHRVMPYLIVEDGQAFLNFTESLFGVKVLEKIMRADGKIRHAEILIGDSCIMFGTATTEFPVQNAMLYIYVEDTDASFKMAMDMGAEAVMEPYDEDYGARSAGLRDPFGNVWWLATLHEQAPDRH
jgi:uncharacterized glyoxalase superfamily protein PhnB